MPGDAHVAGLADTVFERADELPARSTAIT
jgi:hypothetical protein